MINDFFGYGQFLQLFMEGKREYPAMVVNVTSAASDKWYINYAFEVMILQYVNDEQDNRERAMSDCRQILNDLQETVSYSNRWQSFSRLDGAFNVTPAIQKGADKAYGWIGTFTLKVKKRHGICNLQSLMPEYDFETGNITGPTCAPVSIYRDDVFEENVESGGRFYYSTACEDATVTVNGGAFDTVASGETLPITIEYETSLDNPIESIVGNKIIIVDPVVIPTTRIYTKSIDSGATVSYADGDTYWRKINEIGKLVQPEVGVTMRLQYGSKELLQYPNIFNNLYRITGLTGGYRNPIDGLYYTKLGVESTYAESFPFDVGMDHITSDLVDMRATANNRTWFQHCADGLIRTTAVFTGWYLLSVPEAVNYGSWGVTNSYHNAQPPFDWSSGLKVLGDTYPTGTTQCMVIQTYAHITSTTKANTNRAVFIKPININTDVIIT